MLCKKCSHANPDVNNFCGNCGTPLQATVSITLKDVLDAGLLKSCDELTISLRGKDVTATLLAEMYDAQTYDEPLACATAVRGQTCDSWFCWKAIDQATGKSHVLGHFRSALLRQRGESSTAML